MLSLLHIENIAIIESADIQFDPGFNVLTGETGAGKSIVIDAISTVLGQRTSRELIRTGARSARVTAVFTGLGPLPWLEENGVPRDEELLLQRELQADGRGACRVNGRWSPPPSCVSWVGSCWTSTASTTDSSCWIPPAT